MFYIIDILQMCNSHKHKVWFSFTQRPLYTVLASQHCLILALLTHVCISSSFFYWASIIINFTKASQDKAHSMTGMTLARSPEGHQKEKEVVFSFSAYSPCRTSLLRITQVQFICTIHLCKCHCVFLCNWLICSWRKQNIEMFPLPA